MEGEEVNFTVCAQGLGRQAPGRLTRCNYGNRNKKAEATGSAETMCRVGGHLARAGHPRKPRRPRQLQMPAAPPGPPRAEHAEKPLLLPSPNIKPHLGPQPTPALATRWPDSSSTQSRGLGGPSRMTQSWNGPPHKPPGCQGTISEPVSGARGPRETQSQGSTPHLSHSNTSGDFCVQHFTYGR